MIPKKLFTPKCLHADREVVFHEDIQNFYNYFFSKLKEDYREFLLSKKISIKENLIQDEEIFEIINNEETFNYSIFKKYWREKKMSMLHFSKSKEENAKEYYEVLFGEVQYFMNISNRNSLNNQNLTFMYKIISFLTLYSLYYTQTTEFFYQINTTPEILREFNFVISTLKEKFLNKKILREIIAMLNRLYEEDSFSIGALIGLKTIILNKYGLPMEQKQKVYKEYSDIADSVKLIEKNKIDEKEKRKNYMQSLDEYTDVKRQALTLIKGTKGENLNELYCEFINLQLNESKKPYLTSNSILPNYDINKIIISDLQENKITNLDLQFNQVDNNIFSNYKK
jgi:hypothetical protein